MEHLIVDLFRNIISEKSLIPRAASPIGKINPFINVNFKASMPYWFYLSQKINNPNFPIIYNIAIVEINAGSGEKFDLSTKHYRLKLLIMLI